MKMKHFALSILILFTMCSLASGATTVSKVTLQAVDEAGFPLDLDPPVAFSSDNNTAFLGVKNDGIWLNEAPKENLIFDLEPGIHIFHLFSDGLSPDTTRLGMTLTLTNGTTDQELSAFNANASLGSPFLDGINPSAVHGGNKVEVLSFTVNSVGYGANVKPDEVSSGEVASNGETDTTAQLVLMVTPQSAEPFVELDVKPGSHANPFNYKSHGKLPAAVLCFGEFEAASIDVSSIILSNAAMEEARPVKSSLHDLNDDGIVDLMLHFRTQDLASGIESLAAGGATTATLTLKGATLDGLTTFEDSDTVTIIPQKYKPPKQHKEKNK